MPAAEARRLLEEQRQSSLSIAAFARSKGIQPWSLYNAQAMEKRRARRAVENQLAEVQVVERPSRTDSKVALQLTLPSGLSISVTRDFDEIALRRILGVLGSC